jgi:hypothetical protein
LTIILVTKTLKTMKSRHNILFPLLVGLLAAGLYWSCSEDELPNNGEPRIRYIRVTAPESSDSLLAAAYQGSTVAIMGENLQGVVEIWFNDQRASLTPTFITSTTIITSVPSQIPTLVTNVMKLVFANGSTLEYPFAVAISEPELTSMNCEFVNEGDVAVIRGNYFYEPLTVTFTGGVVGELESVEETMIHVKVPAGALPGPVTVSTNFGSIESEFWFRDNRNIFISSDPHSGWWGANLVVSNPEASDPPLINGNYIRIKQVVGAWAWTELAGGPASAMGDISKNIPDDAILNPEDYNFKFEINTLKPYNSNMIHFNMGILSEVYPAYEWVPPYDTEGEWATVVIPFEEIWEAQGQAKVVSDAGYWSRILIFSGSELDADLCFDNLRVVPKVND